MCRPEIESSDEKSEQESVPGREMKKNGHRNDTFVVCD